MALTEHSITLNNKVVHYWQEGSTQQRPVLLLHGGFGNAYVHWSEVMPLLADEYRLIAPDLPGFGQSDPLRDMSLSGLLDWLRALMTALDIDPAVVVGNSFGGLLARLLAAASPARVPAVILVNGGVIPDVPPLAKLLAKLPLLGRLLFNRIARGTSARARLEETLAVPAILTPQFMLQVDANRRGLGRLMRAITVSSIPPAQTPAVPVMLLWGEADTLASLRVAEYLKTTIPGAYLSPISGCGHLPHIEAPEVFATQVSLFLRQMDRGRRGQGAGMLKS